jgi:hypothetical protein
LILRTARPGDDCGGGGLFVGGVNTTPNHVPGLALVALAGVLGFGGVVLLRRTPDVSPTV